MRRAISVGLAAAACGAVLTACGSSSHATITPSNGSSTSFSPTSGANPNAPEASPAGDIPDNQAFVKYVSRVGSYALQVPEGWARTGAGSVTTFASHFNSIRVEATKASAAPTVVTARSAEVPALQRTVSGFSLGKVTSVPRNAGNSVLVTYRAESVADAVTGKRVSLAVERYEFWRNGTSVTLTLSAPKGSDNVDPWKKVTNSFSWSA
jgi:hypothetical protein